MWISGMTDIPEMEPSLPCLPSSSFPLERKTKRKKQRKDKRKIYPYYHHPSYPIPSVRLPSGNGCARSQTRDGIYARVREKGAKQRMKLTRYEQETIINFNAQDQMATLYTRDPAVMRKVDALVIDYPDTFKCIGETDIDKTYEMPKSVVTYRKPRRLSKEQREAAKERLKRNTMQSYKR